MATINPPMNAPAATPAESWRERIKITRMGIFSVLFLLAGLAISLSAPRNFTPETTTTLTFGAGLPQIVVPTLAYAMAVAGLFIAGGVFGLMPLANMESSRKLWLIINGVLIIPTVLILAAANNSANVTVMLRVSVRLSTPIVLGALAGIWCERSGVVNIAIEGMMLTGACFGFAAVSLFAPYMPTAQALWFGVVVAILAGGVMSVLHAWLSIKFKTDQIVSGTVINILAVGITSFTRREILFSSEAGRETLQNIPIPGLSQIPVLGEVLFNGRPIFYSMFILLFVTHIVLFYTRWGLRTRAVGENPHAADTLGINVFRVRWTNVIIAGLIAGLAGAWFSLETTGSFDDNMTGGKGFIGLAAMIFGKWTPFGSAAGGLLFGFSEALAQRFQSLNVPIPPQFLQMAPYIITIIVLAGLVGRAVAPKADGVPYDKEGK
jgi:general nucleoside transport system permease protein